MTWGGTCAQRCLSLCQRWWANLRASYWKELWRERRTIKLVW